MTWSRAAMAAGSALLPGAGLVSHVAAQSRAAPPSLAPAPASRPAAPASRPAAVARPAPATRPLAEPPLPPIPEARTTATPPPVTAPAGGWYATAGLRLDALQAAASEFPLDPSARIRINDRIARARAEVDAAASHGETPAGARAADAILARLDQDVQATLKDAGPRFTARAAQILGEVRDLSRVSTSTFATMFDVLARPSAEQQAKIRQILSDAGHKVEQIELGPRDGLDQRRFAVGFATRSALRGVLSPQQLKDWDELSAAGAGAGAGGPASRPVVPNFAAEIEANYFTRLEAMRLAAEEGPYDKAPAPPDRKAKLQASVQKLKSDIAAAAALPVGPKDKPAADRIDRLRVQFARDTNELLGGLGSKDFDDRVSLIYSQVLMLHNPELPLTHVWISDTVVDLGLTPEQKDKVDQLLKNRVDQLKQAEKETAGQPAPIVRMRKDQVAFATRAAIRQTLTPSQIKMWDKRG
jgi:hypothetical protein